MNARVRSVLAFAILYSIVGMVPVVAAATELASVGAAGDQGDGDSEWPSISGDGRWVAFQSTATNLLAERTTTGRQVFVRDLVTGAVECVSTGSAGQLGDGESCWPAMSADGRFVAFGSEASNLVGGATAGVMDVLIRDRQTGVLERVAVNTSGKQADSWSFHPAVSADGRFVAFLSLASDLVPDDTNATYDVFVRDRLAGTTERVSISSSGEQGNSSSFWPAISADGRFVAFSSASSNLVPDDTNGTGDVFVRDRQSGTTERVSISGSGAQGNADSGGSIVRISSDGWVVAFTSVATNLVPGDSNGHRDVFVRDRRFGITERANVSSLGSEADDDAWRVDISGDGRYVTFSSFASNLVPGAAGGFQVFARDRQTGSTELVSVSSAGEVGDAQAADGIPALSADGRYVAFGSDASNLAPGDTNGHCDAFVRDRDGVGHSYALTVTGANGSVKVNGALKSLPYVGTFALGTIVSLEAVGAPGYHFVSWSGAVSSAENPCTFAGTADSVLVAAFEIDTYAVSLSGSGGTVLVDGASHSLPWSGYFEYGTSIVLTAIPDAEHRFERWSGDVTGSSNPATVAVEEPLAIEAVFSSLEVFSDVAHDFWAAREIAACYAAGIVKGIGDGSYQPDWEVTRDQMAVFIARALAGGDAKVPTGVTTVTFPDDVPVGQWAHDYIEYIADPARGVVQGYDSTHYAPTAVVDRGQLAVFVARAKGWAKLDDDMTTAPQLFPDVLAGFWSGTAIKACLDNGVVQGYDELDGSKTYRPDDRVTRDQMAVFIARAWKLPL